MTWKNHTTTEKSQKKKKGINRRISSCTWLLVRNVILCVFLLSFFFYSSQTRRCRWMLFRVHCWVSQPALSQADELNTMGRYASSLTKHLTSSYDLKNNPEPMNLGNLWKVTSPRNRQGEACFEHMRFKSWSLDVSETMAEPKSNLKTTFFKKKSFCAATDVAGELLLLLIWWEMDKIWGKGG